MSNALQPFSCDLHLWFVTVPVPNPIVESGSPPPVLDPGPVSQKPSVTADESRLSLDDRPELDQSREAKRCSNKGE